METNTFDTASFHYVSEEWVGIMCIWSMNYIQSFADTRLTNERVVPVKYVYTILKYH